MPKRTYTLNGLTKRLPPGKEYAIAQIPRRPYLEAIRDRLQRDVGFLIECLEKRNRREPRIGFFAMVRAVMPIVETLATSEGRYPSNVLADLGYGAPLLMWDLYRNVFLHGDEFVIAAVGETTVQSGVVFTQAHDEEVAKKLARDGLMFDPAYTYRRLLVYLDERIADASDDAMVDVIEVVRYDADSTNKVVKQTVNEIRAIHEAANRPVAGAGE